MAVLVLAFIFIHRSNECFFFFLYCLDCVSVHAIQNQRFIFFHSFFWSFADIWKKSNFLIASARMSERVVRSCMGVYK